MGKLAFLFPGQGSQSVGMGATLYGQSDRARDIFDRAGDQIKTLSFEGPQEQLNLTINAQPCLLITSLACAAALGEKGIYADGAAGFSLGEIPALVYGGIMSPEQAFDFVKIRAQAMHACTIKNKGGMFAVMKLEPDTVIKICKETEGAYPANFNSEQQTVVACHESSFDELKKAVLSHGGKVIRLATSGAFHSPLMAEAKEAAQEYLKSVTMGDMKKPVYANVTAAVYDHPKELLTLQITSPVLWQKTMETMIHDGFDTFVEVGPGKVLSELVKKISGDVRVFHVCDTESLEMTAKSISEGGKNA